MYAMHEMPSQNYMLTQQWSHSHTANTKKITWKTLILICRVSSFYIWFYNRGYPVGIEFQMYFKPTCMSTFALYGFVSLPIINQQSGMYVKTFSYNLEGTPSVKKTITEENPSLKKIVTEENPSLMNILLICTLCFGEVLGMRCF